MRGRTLRVLLGGLALAVTGLALIFFTQNPDLAEDPKPSSGTDPNGAKEKEREQKEKVHVGLHSGDRAPDFELEDLSGTLRRLSDFYRDRGVLLNFWASWCGPCRAEMPDLEVVYQAYREEIVVVGVNLLEHRETILGFLREVPVSYPLLLDAEGEVSRLYRLRIQPATYFIAPGGRIVGQKFGAFTREELEERVQAFLTESRRLHPSPSSPGAQTPPELREAVGSQLTYFSESEMTRFLKTAQDAGLDPNRVPYVADLDKKLLKLGCPFVDCIPSIDGPEFESPEEADSWLQPEDLVLGLTMNGIAKAYPLKILNWHEIVNDTFGTVPVVVTYCPLCNSGVAFLREVDGKAVEFGVSGRLYKSDLVMYDRATGTFWSQIEGRAIVGPLAGRILTRLPLDVLPWEVWRELHPSTLVLARPTIYTPVGGEAPLAERRARARSGSGSGSPRPIGGGTQAGGEEFLRNYDIDPYAGYRTNNYDTFGTPFPDRRLEAKANVWGLVLEGRGAKAYAEETLKAVGLLNDELQGVPLLVLWAEGTVRVFRREIPSGGVLTFAREGQTLVDRETTSRWDLSGTALEGPLQGTRLAPLTPIKSFWFAWVAFYPDTELFVREEPFEETGTGTGG